MKKQENDVNERELSAEQSEKPFVMCFLFLTGIAQYKNLTIRKIERENVNKNVERHNKVPCFEMNKRQAHLLWIKWLVDVIETFVISGERWRSDEKSFCHHFRV